MVITGLVLVLQGVIKMNFNLHKTTNTKTGKVYYYQNGVRVKQCIYNNINNRLGVIKDCFITVIDGNLIRQYHSVRI